MMEFLQLVPQTALCRSVRPCCPLSTASSTRETSHLQGVQCHRPHTACTYKISLSCCQGLRPHGPFRSQHNSPKSSQWAAWAPLSCWLVFRNSILQSRCVRSSNVLYPLVFVIVDFFRNELCLSSFTMLWFLLWLNSVYFMAVLKKFISVAVILDLSCFFSVQVSLPYSRVGIVWVLCILSLVCF
jgi:hypothetical protein